MPSPGATTPPHASDVAGWTSLGELRALGEARESAEVTATVGSLAHPKPVSIGIGADLAHVLDASGAHPTPSWPVALVQADGRVAGIMRREALERTRATAPGRAED